MNLDNIIFRTHSGDILKNDDVSTHLGKIDQRVSCRDIVSQA